MRVLAIDTALEACAAAVLDTTGDIIAGETLAMTRGHAEALMPLIARVMDEAGGEFSSLDRIAVTVGPGSFTGLRVGIAAARGIALAAGKPAVGLSTLAALAAPYVAAAIKEPIVSAIDALHGQVYLQVFASGATVVEPRLVGVGDAVEVALGAGVIIGSGAALLSAQWPPGAGAARIDDRRAPDIAWVARLGAVAAETGAMPRPLYLQRPGVKPPAPQLARQ